MHAWQSSALSGIARSLHFVSCPKNVGSPHDKLREGGGILNTVHAFHRCHESRATCCMLHACASALEPNNDMINYSTFPPRVGRPPATYVADDESLRTFGRTRAGSRRVSSAETCRKGRPAPARIATRTGSNSPGASIHARTPLRQRPADHPCASAKAQVCACVCVALARGGPVNRSRRICGLTEPGTSEST
jgi:hypothetical protein